MNLRALVVMLVMSAIALACGQMSEVRAAAAAGVTYHVDCAKGSDANDGLSEVAPWRTLERVEAQKLVPSDSVGLARGCTWDEGFSIRASGNAASPISFFAYGAGPRPTIRNAAAGMWAAAIDVYAEYVVIDGLGVRDAHEAGIELHPGADHTVVRDVEATAVGEGFAVRSRHNLLTRNYVHDLTMVVDTPGGDDDYGAVGFWLAAPDNEISYNVAVDNSAHSYDYGTDGGFVEIFGDGDNSFIHHNWAERNNGFLEVGAGSEGGSADNVRVSYNVGVENGLALCLHSGGSFATDFDALRLDHNTFIESGAGPMLQCMARSAAPGALIVRNNVFATNAVIDRSGSFTHGGNLYLSGAIGYPLDPSEKVGDPKFVDASTRNLRLQPGSPAIDSAADLGYVTDFLGGAVPQGIAPDIGAFEFGTGVGDTNGPTVTVPPS